MNEVTITSLARQLAALLAGKTVVLHTVKTTEDNGCTTRVETRERICIANDAEKKQ